MKRFIVLFVALFLSAFITKAQWGEDDLEEKPTFSDRIFTGGGIGLSFTSYSDFFSISPLIGYKITNKLAAGVQFQYRYTNYKVVTPRISTHDYGASPFARYFIYPPFFIHAEYEYLNYQFVGVSKEKFRRSFNSFMGGGGFFQPIGRRAGFFALALYNFSYATSYDYSPYNSPWVFRVGITAGF
jgi:hypothetical protein